MSQTEILVKELRDLADALERLDEQPLPKLYVSAGVTPDGAAYSRVQVVVPAAFLGEQDSDELYAERLAVVQRLTDAGLYGYTARQEPEPVSA